MKIKVPTTPGGDEVTEGSTPGPWRVFSERYGLLPEPHLTSPMMGCLAFCCRRSSIRTLPTEAA